MLRNDEQLNNFSIYEKSSSHIGMLKLFYQNLTLNLQQSYLLESNKLRFAISIYEHDRTTNHLKFPIYVVI